MERRAHDALRKRGARIRILYLEWLERAGGPLAIAMDTAAVFLYIHILLCTFYFYNIAGSGFLREYVREI